MSLEPHSSSSGDFIARSRKVVEEFLQSVVILDDRAHLTDRPTDHVTDVERPGFVRPVTSTISSSEVTDDAGGSSGRDGEPLYVKPIVDRFAELGATCAVLRPSQGDEFRAKVSEAAARADIVVLDWVIGNSIGTSTIEVIRDILKRDQASGRMRLIAIYTGEPILDDISGSVKSAVGDLYPDSVLTSYGSYSVTKGPVTVLILAKEDTLSSDGQNDPLSQEVSELELADRLVNEFTKMTEGLLCNVALACMASLRSNVHRLLAKLDRGLDPAYLGHRLLLPHPPDAEDHVVEMLGAELLSILQEGVLGQEAGIAAIEDWLVTREMCGLDLSSPFPFQTNDEIVAKCLKLLKVGTCAKSETGLQAGTRPLNKQATEIFSGDAAEAALSNRLFSALFNLKSLYPESQPKLTLGTILLKRSGWSRQYLLCLQPKCDSVRLSSPTGFPLVPMEVVENDSKRFRIAVNMEPGEWELLDFSESPSSMTVTRFKPGPNPPGEVVAFSRRNRFYFKDTQQRVYRWVAQMKDEHALKIAGNFASALARPGPNDSEWIRLAGRRQYTSSAR